MSPVNVCKIKSFVGGENPLSAITVNFDCGHLVKEEANKVTCDVLSDAEEGNRVVLLSRKNQLYSGVPTDSICNTLYLIRNKKTGKAKLVSSSSCQLVNCTHRRTSQKAADETTRGESYLALAAAFGSKKTKRRTEIAQKMWTTAASNSDVLDETISSMNNTMEVDSEVPTDSSIMASLLPSCNRDASVLEDVYSVDKLLTKNELEELRGFAELCMNTPQDIESDSQFLVLPYFKCLGEGRTLIQVQLLLYANSLINFTRLSNFEISGKMAVEKICAHSKMIGTKIWKGFTANVGTKRVRTPTLTDRAYCHAIVAILLACDYKFNATWFFGCLKGCKKTKLPPLLRVVGLVPLSWGAKGSQFTHHMKLPLPQISLTKIQSRGKKK